MNPPGGRTLFGHIYAAMNMNGTDDCFHATGGIPSD
jgi:hypothetical protein